jgi:hypothetical protein
MAEFNPKGSNYLKYTDPKTDAKTKAKLWATYGKRYNWPKEGAAAPGDGTPPPVTLPPNSGNSGAGVPVTQESNLNTNVQGLFGQDAGAFNSGRVVADELLGKVSEDPRITDAMNRLKTQSEQGLLATENTALRESALQGINDALQVAQRQSGINAVGAGRPTGMDNPAIFNDYLRARGGLESDILSKNIDYKTGQQSAYGTLLTGRDNELFNRNYGRSQDVLGYATSGAGWSADQRQQKKANDLTEQAIKAMSAVPEAGGAALSIPGVSQGFSGGTTSSGTNGANTGDVFQNKNRDTKTSWLTGSGYSG